MMKKKMKEKIENKNIRIEKAKEYVKVTTWKKFFKYKAVELIGIPIGTVAGWKIPLWVGNGLVNLFNIDVNNSFFCNRIESATETMINQWTGEAIPKAVCDGIGYNTAVVWFFGLIVLVLTSAFLYINYTIAKENATEEAKDKYGKKDKSSWTGMDIKYSELE
jgi:hypothetical protein